MRILDISSERDLNNLMRRINVDPYGIKIMIPKSQHRLLKINSLNNVSANILKQEMLSLGGDVALAKGALTGRVKKTDCLVMGDIAQFNRLSSKLRKQPFGLNRLAQGMDLVLESFQKRSFCLRAGEYRIKLGNRAYIMGIVNVTEDSFSGDGLLNRKAEEIVRYALNLVKDGADIVDVGGESTRPGAKKLPLKDEAKRLIPVIRLLVKKIRVPVSVDTYKPEIARMALDCGASIVNDVSGLRDDQMAKVVSRYKAAVIIVHMLKNPRTMQVNPLYNSLIDDIYGYLEDSIQKAEGFGIGRESIIIDPGIGFGKTVRHNLEIIKRLSEFKSLGKPVLIGTSRKSFLGKLLKLGPYNRVFGTVSSCVNARINKADILRVHDVKAVREALKITDSINK